MGYIFRDMYFQSHFTVLRECLHYVQFKEMQNTVKNIKKQSQDPCSQELSSLDKESKQLEVKQIAKATMKCRAI